MRRMNPMGNGVMSTARPAVPPGGFAGVATQTPVARSTTFSRPTMAGNTWFLGRKASGAPKRRRRKSKKAAPMKKRKRTGKKRTSSKKAKRFVKGSAAAKRFMARLRAKRKK